jgi:hypothetical protein
VQFTNLYRSLAILVLRVGVIFILVMAGWVIYKRLPPAVNTSDPQSTTTSVQIVLHQASDSSASDLDVAVDLYPVDIVAVRHEYFAERRAGKGFDEFLKDRMKGRTRVSARLDKLGHGAVVLTPGNWWLHAKLSGDEELEWRLPISVTGAKQIVELTPQNAYTRSKTF